MDFIKDKKVIGMSCLLIIILLVSMFTYGRNKNKVFKDEYMKDIFVEEDEVETLSNNSVSNEVKNEIVVEIKGEVAKPDVYRLEEGSIVKELIDMAGGLTSDADISKINRAKKLQNHELIVISNINDTSNNDGAVASVAESDGLVNINTASSDELKKIPGVGDVKAQSIIDYREKSGGFKNIEEIKNIDGIGEKTFEKIKDKITL